MKIENLKKAAEAADQLSKSLAAAHIDACNSKDVFAHRVMIAVALKASNLKREIEGILSEAETTP